MATSRMDTSTRDRDSRYAQKQSCFVCTSDSPLCFFFACGCPYVQTFISIDSSVRYKDSVATTRFLSKPLLHIS